MDLSKCYQLLGLSNETPFNLIKRRYRELAFKYHPDRNPNNPKAEKNFKEVTQAYETIDNILNNQVEGTEIIPPPDLKSPRAFASLKERMAVRAQRVKEREPEIPVRVRPQNIFNDWLDEVVGQMPGIKSRFKSPSFWDNYKPSYIFSRDFREAKSIVEISRKALPREYLSLESILRAVFEDDTIDEAEQILSEIESVSLEELDFFANCLIYAKDLYKESESDKNNLKMILDTANLLSGAESLEQMLVCASSTRAILGDYGLSNFKVTKGSVDSYFERYQDLFKSLTRSMKTEDDFPKLTKLMEITREYFPSELMGKSPFDEQAKLVNLMLTDKSVEEADKILNYVRCFLSIKFSGEYIFKSSFKVKGWSKDLSILEDTRKRLQEEKGYSNEDFLCIFNIIDTIDRTYEVSFDLAMVKKINNFVSILADEISETVPSGELYLAENFVKSLCSGSRAYLSSKSQLAQEEWRRTFQTYFVTHQEYEEEFSEVMEVLGTLKYDHKGKRNRYGIGLRFTVESAAYLGIEMSKLSDENPNIISEWNYIVAEFVENNMRFSKSLIRRKALERGITPQQEHVYTVFDAAKSKRKGIPRNFLTISDVDKILEIYR